MLAKASTLEADAVILDVEDGVAAKDKQTARTAIGEVVPSAPRAPGALWFRDEGIGEAGT